MTDMALPGSLEPAIPSASRPNLDKGFNPLTMILFFGVLAGGTARKCAPLPTPLAAAADEDFKLKHRGRTVGQGAVRSLGLSTQ